MKWLFAPILLVFCNILTTQSALALECRPATQEQISRVRTVMETLLLDAQSARFRDVCVVPRHGEVIRSNALCGLVNAKNQYGAYVGYRPFSWVMVARTAFIADPNSRDPNTNLSYDFACTTKYDK